MSIYVVSFERGLEGLKEQVYLYCPPPASWKNTEVEGQNGLLRLQADLGRDGHNALSWSG